MLEVSLFSINLASSPWIAQAKQVYNTEKAVEYLLFIRIKTARN